MSKRSLDLNNIQIIYEGILKKSPPLKSKSLFNMIAKFSCATDKEKTSIIFQKRWRKRYFILFKNSDKSHDLHFLYFKSKPSPDSRSLGSINMENFGSLAVDVGKKVNKANVFSIQTVDEKGDNRVYYLSATSFELMHIWVDKFVTCLDLNKDNNYKVRNSTPTMNSPMSHSFRSIPRSSHIRPSVSGVHTVPNRLTKLSVDSSRMSLNTRQNENSLTYYNMDRYFTSNLSENLEDPISAEDEDTYKFPCESGNDHSYFNLGDVSVTPIPKESNNFNQVFFGNDQNFPDLYPDLKPTGIHFQNDQKNLKSSDSEFNGKQIDLNQYKSENLINLRSIDQDHDFNFELPKRVKSDDSSSSSSCYSSTNTNSSTKEFELPNDSVSFKELKGIGPPQVPKRLNISENPILPPPRAQTFNVTLPTKSLKTIKPENYDSRNNNSFDEASTTLNYLDATNLLLENKPLNISNSGFSAFPNLPDPFLPVFNDSPKISPDIKIFSDLSPGHELIGNFPLDSISSNFSVIVPKDVSLVEYSEINDARTEGLHKLNERILKNE